MTVNPTPSWETPSRATLFVTIALIVALLAVLTWLPKGMARMAEQMRGAGAPRLLRERATTEPSDSRVAYRAASRRVRHASVGAQRRMRVTDAVTGDVLAGASIITQVGVRVGPSASDGMLDLPPDSGFHLPAKLMVTIDGEAITVPVEGIYDDADANVAVVTAPINFRLVIDLRDTSHPDNDVSINLADFPAMPDAAAIAPMALDVLSLNRAIPETYLGILDARHLRPHPFSRETSVHLVEGRGHANIVMRYHGPTVMMVRAPGCMGVTQMVTVETGNERRLSITLRPQPVVGGTVVDQHGVPVAGAAVHILCLAALATGEFANASNGRGAVGLVGNDATKVVTEEWSLTLTSGDDGRFEAVVPFTEDVVAYVVDAHTRFCKAERRSARSASQIGLKLIAAPPDGDFRVRVVDDATGEPLVGCTGTLLQAADDNHWGIVLPALPIDQEGYLHMDGLRVAATYALTVTRGEQTLGDASVFVASRDATVRVKLRK